MAHHQLCSALISLLCIGALVPICAEGRIAFHIACSVLPACPLVCLPLLACLLSFVHFQLLRVTMPYASPARQAGCLAAFVVSQVRTLDLRDLGTYQALRAPS